MEEWWGPDVAEIAAGWVFLVKQIEKRKIWDKDKLMAARGMFSAVVPSGNEGSDRAAAAAAGLPV